MLRATKVHIYPTPEQAGFLTAHYDLNTACDQIRLYSIKVGIDPDGRDSLTAIKELRDAVKEHNKSIRAKDKK